MPLTAIQVSHYKSLTNVAFNDLGAVTVLVGANAVGKSNVIDALRFLRDAIADGLDHAISSRGGIEVIREYSPYKPFDIRFRAEYFTENQEFGNLLGHYELVIRSLQKGNYRVEREEAAWHEIEAESPFDKESDLADQDRSVVQHTFTRDAEGGMIVDGVDGEDVLPPDLLAISSRRSLLWNLPPLVLMLRRCRFSALYPRTLREPSRPETDTALREDGSNWASVLKALKKTERNRRSFERILERMRLLLPGLQDVQVRGIGGYLVPQFLVKDHEGAKSHFFDPLQLSDGTLRVFGILLALYQRPLPLMLALEEPEQAIHPGAIAILAEAFKEVSSETQIILTSHSPHLVDYFDPAEIRVVSMKQGETIVGQIRKNQLESIKRRLLSAGEIMSAEGLQSEA